MALRGPYMGSWGVVLGERGSAPEGCFLRAFPPGRSPHGMEERKAVERGKAVS